MEPELLFLPLQSNAWLVQLGQTVLNGLVSASIIALGAVGLTLSYGVTRFINFAYGEFLTYGAYLVLAIMSIQAVSTALGTWGSFVAALLLSVTAIAVLAVLINRYAYEPLRDRGPIPLLITSIGVAFILRSLLRGVAGSDGMSYPVPLLRPITFFGLNLSVYDAVGLIIGAVVVVIVHLLLSRTLIGRKMRATSGNERLARIAGIDIQRVIRHTWLISAGAGALAGILLGLRFSPFTPSMGWRFLLVVFASTILGGIGKPYGAILGALVIGMTMSFGTFYLSSEYTFGYAFVVLVVTLLFRPEGIRGGEI